MRRSQLRMAVGIAALLVHAAPSAARACSVDACWDPVRTFAPDAVVPGNLVRFELSENSIAADIDLVLVTSAGTVVPLHERAYGEGPSVVEPVEPVAANTQLELRYSYGCPGRARERHVYRFSTSAQEPLEWQPAELVALGISPVVVGSMSYRYEPPVSDAAAHLAITAATVDGQGLGTPDSGPAFKNSVLTVHASCERSIHADICNGPHGLPAGKHTVQLYTRIVGEAEQPEPLVREIEVQCGSLSCAVARAAPSSSAGVSGLSWLALAAVLVVRRRRAT